METADNLPVVPAEVETLKDEAYQARLDVAHVRSICPSLCANLVQKSLKNDIIISKTFKVDFGNDEPIKPAFGSAQDITNLGLKRKIVFSSEKTKALESRSSQISAALDVISKNIKSTSWT